MSPLIKYRAEWQPFSHPLKAKTIDHSRHTHPACQSQPIAKKIEITGIMKAIRDQGIGRTSHFLQPLVKGRQADVI